MSSTQHAINPITYEIIRHRLWRITSEQGHIIIRTSGSPVTFDAKDFSTGIFSPEGEGLFISAYSSLLGLSLCSVTKAVAERFGDDLRPGDMFLCNDPWTGGVGHPNDQAMVGPLFHDDRLVGWAGVVLHDADVGATVPGVHPTAPNARHEGPLIPPVRIVERGVLRKDLEHWAIRNVREPAANSIHIRARMAAISNTQSQISEIIDARGVETYLEFIQAYVDRNRRAIETRLRELPDGKWFEEIFMDHDGTSPKALSRIHCEATKSGSSLTFDFSHSDGPAPGPLNCTEKGLYAAVASAVMGTLCYDTGWCPAALSHCLKIVSRPDTIVNARYPTPVGLATTSSMGAAAVAVRSCFTKMFAASEPYRHRAIALTGSAGTGSMIWARDAEGQVHTTLGTFMVTKGTGAYCSKDGADGGGPPGAPAMALYNIEVAEFTNPLVMVLYRREAPETAGAGQFRGGAGMEAMLVLRPGVDRLHVNWGAMAFHHPHGKGLYGGLPGSVSGVEVLRGTDLRAQLAAGHLPSASGDLGSRSTERVEAKTVDVQLQPDDVLRFWIEGGGGFGDPLERDPAMIARDVAAGLCTREAAESIYGVVAAGEKFVIDARASEERREQIRKARLARAEMPADFQGRRRADGSVLQPIGLGLLAVRNGTSTAVACARCDHVFGPENEDPKRHAALGIIPLEEASSYNKAAFDAGEIELREFLCPSCGSRIGTEIRKTNDPPLLDYPETRRNSARLEVAA